MAMYGFFRLAGELSVVCLHVFDRLFDHWSLVVWLKRLVETHRNGWVS
jgi:hypothetical protein